jgi:mannose-6-phosphate isomerase-like protein (cupin superfamily)
MRRSRPVLSTCLLGLMLATTLLSIGTIWPMPADEHAFREVAAATTDRPRIEPVGRTRLPPRRGDEGVGIVRPLVDLSLLAAPTAAGASLVAERLTYAPGATLSGRRQTQVRVIFLESGTLEARIDGVAFLDRRGPAVSLLAPAPNRVEGVVDLHPGDVLAVPAEAAFATRNPGEIPAVSLQVSVQLPQPLTPMTDRTGDTSDSDDIHSELVVATIALPPGISAEVTVARIILPPGRSIVANRTRGPALFIVERGLLGATRDGREVERASGDAELVPSGEQLTISSTGDEPLASLLLTITPAESNLVPA